MALPTPRRQPRRLLTLGISLCVILLPLAQAGFGALSLRMSSPWYWLVGTPLSYLIIAGVGAFCMTGELARAQASSRGALVGVLAGSGGAIVATLVLAVIVAVEQFHFLHGSPSAAAAQQTMPPLALNAAVPAPLLPGMLVKFVTPYVVAMNFPPIPPILVAVFFAPFFLADNLLGVGLASLGGWLGGLLRGSLTRHGAPPGEQPGGVNVVVAVTVAVVLAILLAVAGIVYATGAFPLFNAGPAH